MKEPMDLHARILERLQTKGRTQAETLAKDLKETQGMVLVCLHDSAKARVCSTGPVAAFQSTPARGGRPWSTLPFVADEVVSIHARARRATILPPRSAPLSFQSTPARGGRRLVPLSLFRFPDLSFNPRPRAAGDGEDRVPCSLALFQSTPARGGRRGQRLLRGQLFYLFQSTPARGGRQAFMGRRAASFSFNPRPRAAGDAGRSRTVTDQDVSIHARARRATSRLRRS